MENVLSLTGCLAIKQGDLAKAGLCLEQAITMQDEVFLQAFRDILVMAIRRHQYEVLTDWMELALVRLKEVLAKPNMFEQSQSFLESFIFAVCDHRLANLREEARACIEVFKSSTADAMQFKAFYLELASLASRMAARKWDDEAIWLLDIVLNNALQDSNLKLLEDILFQVNMHAVMNAKLFGFSHMLYIYKVEQFAYMTLVALAGHEDIDEKDAVDYLHVCLRNERNLMTNIARITMKDAMDIYQAWFDHMLYFYGKDEHLKTLSVLLIQLTLSYWQGTQPKSSRRQIPFLDKVMNPSYINNQYQKLLAQIL